jgi:hypothetical protein
VWAILQIIVLEVLAWVYILANRPMRMHRKK